MEKTYKIISVQMADINIQNCTNIAVEAIRDYLWDYYGIDYDKHEQILPELIKDIIENLKKTY